MSHCAVAPDAGTGFTDFLAAVTSIGANRPWEDRERECRAAHAAAQQAARDQLEAAEGEAAKKEDELAAKQDLVASALERFEARAALVNPPAPPGGAGPDDTTSLDALPGRDISQMMILGGLGLVGVLMVVMVLR